MRHLLTAVLGLTLASAARGESLRELLDAVAANARFAPPARADVRIECGAGCAAAGKRAVVLGRGDRVYLEIEDGFRALVAPDGIFLGAEAKRVEPGTALDGTDLALEDVAVFGAKSLVYPQISDDTGAEVVVNGAPAGASKYALLVYTIDRERRTVRKTQYYEGSIGNLTKMRRDLEPVDVDGHWRPGEIRVERLGAATSTRLRLTWRAAPDAPPALFEPAGLTRPSGLTFP